MVAAFAVCALVRRRSRLSGAYPGHLQGLHAMTMAISTGRSRRFDQDRCVGHRVREGGGAEPLRRSDGTTAKFTWRSITARSTKSRARRSRGSAYTMPIHSRCSPQTPCRRWYMARAAWSGTMAASSLSADCRKRIPPTMSTSTLSRLNSGSVTSLRAAGPIWASRQSVCATTVWRFGCYGKPAVTLRTDDAFRFLGKHAFNCSVGVARAPDSSELLSRKTSSTGDKRNTATVAPVL